VTGDWSLVNRASELVNDLERFYGRVPEPPHDPFAFFVWDVLSVHSTPRQRDAALAALKRIPALTPDALHRAPAKKIADAVALAGSYAEPRVRALRTGVDLFRRTPRVAETIRGRFSPARRAAGALPQLAGSSTHRMLLFAGGHAVMPVDAPVARVVARLAGSCGPGVATSPRTRRRIRAMLTAGMPKDADAYRRVYLYLAHHAAATCAEADPHCGVCPLTEYCASARP
jgi:endonuclease III